MFFGGTPTTTSASAPRALHTPGGIYSRSTSASCFAAASAAQSATLWSASDFHSCGLGEEEAAGVDGRRPGASRSCSPSPDTSVGGRGQRTARRHADDAARHHQMRLFYSSVFAAETKRTKRKRRKTTMKLFHVHGEFASPALCTLLFALARARCGRWTCAQITVS